MKLLRTAAIIFCSLCATPWAQQPAATQPAPGNVVQNGGFERSLQSPNLWSGVDKDGCLAGFRMQLPVLNENGNIGDAPLPVSPAVGDLNGDKLPDILASDPMGYIRVYFNSGTPNEPKFTIGELTTPYLALREGEPPWRLPTVTSGDWGRWTYLWSHRRKGVSVALVDSGNSGKLDLIAGTYSGEIFFIPNRGGNNVPQFPQPQSLVKDAVQFTKDPNYRWGNVFAPLLYDWDGNKQPDLLVGEGSYSANNVHFFPNLGSGASPAFSQDKRQPLALGEGREQLRPALADVNGDGQLDLIVADRKGRVTAYLRPQGWKFGDTIKPSGFLSKTGGLTQDEAQAMLIGTGINAISTGDFNGDGLFDLVVGKNTGRIALALNKGSKEQPKFEAAADLKGTVPTPATWQTPSQWDIDVGLMRGNAFAYATCIGKDQDNGADPREGTKVLKFGYAPCPNKFIAKPSWSNSLPGGKTQKELSDDSRFRISAEERARDSSMTMFVMRQNITFEIGKTYTLSFQAKGSKISNGKVIIGWRGYKKIGEARKVQLGRGAVQVIHNDISEARYQDLDFNASPSWGNVTKPIKIDFKDKPELNGEKLTSEGMIEISFELAAPDGFLYIDDVRLVPSA